MRGLLGRASASVWISVLAGLVAVVGFLVLTADAEGAQVVVVDDAVGAGEVVEAGMLRVVDLSGTPGVVDGLVSASELGRWEHRVARRSLPAGTLLAWADLASPADAARPRAMSIPLDPTAAVGGRIEVGERVDVIDASDEARWVAVGAEVLDVGATGGSGVLASGSRWSITIAVTSTEALEVAAAIAGGKVQIVRSGGATIAP